LRTLAITPVRAMRLKQFTLLLGRDVQSGSQFARLHGAKISHLDVCQCGRFEFSKLACHAVILFSAYCLSSNNGKLE
jgi:hypothetical protein